MTRTRESLCEVRHTGTGFLMREIVIDTETTGLDPLNGDRIVEIGAVELVNRCPTGYTFHRYLCPERSIANRCAYGAWFVG
jgi:DNA polymerase III epsilon subunit-like protein